VSQGQVDAAWDAVGADAVGTTTAPAGLPQGVAALDGSRGLTVATATTIPGAQVIGSRLDTAVTIVAVDADAMARLLAASPAPDAPVLASLAVRGTSAVDPLPILLTGGRGPETATLRWGDESVAVRPVGDASALPTNVTGTGIVAVVDRELLATSVGHDISATRSWVVGADAEAGLVAVLAGDPDATVATRTGWLAGQASAPVTLALGWLFAGAGAVATALATLAVVLMAASGSWERTRAAAQTRVLGLRRPDAARIAWLEATIPAVVASAVGIAVGMGLAGLLVVALDLRSVTGGREAPHLVVGWWSLAIPLALGLVARIAVAAAALAHRGERLGSLLRAG
jgi:putative ABC transport system permease protein